VQIKLNFLISIKEAFVASFSKFVENTTIPCKNKTLWMLALMEPDL